MAVRGAFKADCTLTEAIAIYKAEGWHGRCATLFYPLLGLIASE